MCVWRCCLRLCKLTHAHAIQATAANSFTTYGKLKDFFILFVFVIYFVVVVVVCISSPYPPLNSQQKKKYLRCSRCYLQLISYVCKEVNIFSCEYMKRKKTRLSERKIIFLHWNLFFVKEEKKNKKHIWACVCVCVHIRNLALASNK